MTAVTGRDPGELYDELTAELGEPVYERIDAPATPRAEGDARQALAERRHRRPSSPASRSSHVLTTAPGNGAPIGGLKVVTENGWFAARPSGTEDVYKLYAESFVGEDHLRRIQAEAQALVSRAFAAGGAGR